MKKKIIEKIERIAIICDKCGNEIKTPPATVGDKHYHVTTCWREVR